MVVPEPAASTSPRTDAQLPSSLAAEDNHYTDAKRPAIVGCILLLLSLLLYLINPGLLYLKYALRIREGSDIYNILGKEMETMHMTVYLFNVTNGERFTSGEDEKLKVEEVGPFLYKEMRINKDMRLNSAYNILEYTPYFNFTLRENSVLNPADVNVTMPNLVLLFLSSMVSHQSPWMQIPFNLMMSKQNSKAIVKKTAESYLWGYDEPLITLGNTLLPGWIHFKRLGILDRFLDRERPGRLAVGATNADKFQVKTVNGMPGMPQWGYGERNSDCNTFTDAYEGLSYPPGMTPDRRLRIFRKVLCRLLDLEYAGTVMTDLGVKALKYKMGRDTFDYSGKNQCICPQGNCTKGYYVVSPCFYGFPLAISQGHFLDSDPKLFERIEGLHPNSELHGCEILIEPTSGFTLKNTLTIQVSVKVDNVTFNGLAKPFANMVVPIAWFRVEMPPLKEDVIYNVKWIGNYGPKIFYGTIIFLTAFGIFFLACSARHILCKPSKNISYKIGPIKTTT